METPGDDLRDLLEENLELTKENNKMLKAMRRDAIISGVLKTLVWAVVIVSSFYFTAKYLEPLLGTFTQAATGMDEAKFNELIELYRSSQQ